MRVRIVERPGQDLVDGIRLDVFEPGGVYDVGNLIGALLLAEQWAEPVADSAPRGGSSERRRQSPNHSSIRSALPTDSPRTPPNLIREIRSPHIEQLDRAADASRRKRRRPR